MAIHLYSDQTTLLEQAPQPPKDGLIALLTTPKGTLAEPLQAKIPDLIVVDVTGDRLRRLNFDALRVALIDLPSKALLSSGGRRLMDALGRLAAPPPGEDELTLCFYGPAITAVGAFLDDGTTAALNLIPQTVVLPNMQQVSDLNALLTHISSRGLRLLALDHPVSARYDHRPERVTTHGSGHVLLMAFYHTPGNEQPTARLQTLTHGMTRPWSAM
jgi:hypothetical protein